MNQYTLFVLLSPFGCAIALMVAITCIRHRDLHASRTLAIAISTAMFYLAFNTLELADPTPEGTLFFAQLCYPLIGSFTISWLAFALDYSDRERWLKSIPFRLLWVIPFITTVMVFTNPYHHLIWKQYTFIPLANGYLYMKVLAYGGWYWVFFLHSHMLILLSMTILVSASIKSRKFSRIQSNLVVLAALWPIIGNLVYVLHLIPGLQKDFSPLNFIVSCSLLATSLFRYRLLDLTPVARTNLIDNMNDCMITLEPSKRVVDFNPAALCVFSNAQIGPLQAGKVLSVFDPYLRQFEDDSTNDLLQAEIALPVRDDRIYFDLQIRRLRDKNGVNIIGYLLVMHAITEHKKMLNTMRKLANEDTLTGVFSRRRLFELARQEINGIRATPPCFSIMMIDIDHFKEVNDSFGHDCGDQLLQAFAQQLRVILRSADLIGRIGGDEFIVLLPDTALENARQLAERLCQQVAAKPMGTKDYGALPITISIGVAEYSTGGSETLEAFMVRADKGLYQAKTQGRNRACIHGETP